MTTNVPDYISEDNWKAILALLPRHETEGLPTYAEASKSLNKLVESGTKTGVVFRKVEINASEWESWVKANGDIFSYQMIVVYTQYKAREEDTGKPVGFRINRSAN